MVQDDEFQQTLAATAQARPQSSNPSSCPPGHRFEAIQERPNRQASHVDKVLRTDNRATVDCATTNPSLSNSP
jgi:hypothetical protein